MHVNVYFNFTVHVGTHTTYCLCIPIHGYVHEALSALFFSSAAVLSGEASDQPVLGGRKTLNPLCCN